MKKQFISLSVLSLFFSVLSGFSQTYSSKTFAYYDDYIITAKDTLYGRIDESTIHASSVSYLPAGESKPEKVKSSKVLEIKSRFIFKRVKADGKSKLLKVLTEGPVSLYSEERKGRKQLSDKTPEEIPFAQTREIPSRSEFYLKKASEVVKLNRDNYKTTLKTFLDADEKLKARIDSMEYSDLEFTLLNMVIGYNFKQEE